MSKWKDTEIGTIPENWQVNKIGEIADVTKLAGYEYTKYFTYVEDGEIIALRALNVREGILDLTNIKRIYQHVSDNLVRSKLFKGDLLFTYVGANIGQFALVDENDKYHLAPNICRIRAKENCLPFFIYSYFRTNYFKENLNNYSVGSSQPTMPMGNIRQIKIPVPPLPEQIQIASILSSLDDKIDLLHRQNKTLEQLAETLFRQWFVEEAEESWEVGKLEDLINVKYGKDHKKLNDGKIPAFGSGGIMRKVERSLYDSESVLIPRKGTLNNVIYIDEPFWTVDTMFYTEMKRPNIAKFIYHFIKGQDLASMNVGSAVPSMTTEILNNMPVNIPPDSFFKKFEDGVSDLYKKIKSNQTQIRTLTQLRDTLLPKLMSGEVRVV